MTLNSMASASDYLREGMNGELINEIPLTLEGHYTSDEAARTIERWSRVYVNASSIGEANGNHDRIVQTATESVCAHTCNKHQS